ncbi:MAG: hypothetical protein H0T51_17045 [Pirellulales bacterium]|nr:hypothetical protein [Pirellulales bacterium]
MSAITASCEWLLRRSAVWGGLLCFAFHVLVVQNLPPDSTVYRWFAGDGAQIKAVISLLAFVGAATLVLKLFGLIVQFGALDRCSLSTPTIDGQSPEDVDRLIADLEACPRSLQDRYLIGRLRAALHYVKQVGSADALASQLPLLADADRRTMQHSYSGVRTIGLCIPIVGLLGAAAGGAQALAALRAGGEQALVGALAGGQLALEVVGQAFAVSIALLFARLFVEKVELRLLAAVDAAAGRQLLGRFRQYGSAADPRAATVVRLCEKLLESVQTAVAQHDAAISKSINVASRRWEDAASTAAALLHRTVGEALTNGLKDHAQLLNEGVAKQTADMQTVVLRHAEILSENIDEHTGALADALEHHTAVITQCETNLAAENRRHLGELEGALGEAVLVASTRQEKLITQSENLLREMQAALVESAGVAVAQQEQLTRQGDVLLRVIEATGQVRRLEEALNSNLASLAGAHHFEETVVGLSAALQLLSANLGGRLSLRDEISLDGDQRTSHAA